MRYGSEVSKYEKQNKKSECITYKLSKEEIDKIYGENKIIERKQMNKELKIDLELRDLLPPLKEEEFQKLESLILKEGCKIPIALWNDYIADGHNRYNICTKHNLPFETYNLAFESKEDVMEWMIDTQLGRRNLNPIERVEVAEKYRPFFKKKAEESYEKTVGRPSDNKSLQKSATIQKVHTRDELAKIAKVSHDTYGKAKKIIDLEKESNEGKTNLSANQKEIINKVKKEEIKINTAYNELFGKKEKKKQTLDNQNKLNSDDIYEVESTNTSSDIDKMQSTDEIQNVIIPNDNIKDIIAEMKIPKNAEDYFNFLDEVECIQESLQEPINVAFDVLFERHNIDGRVTLEERDIALEYIEDILSQINQLKNKIKNINLKENN